MKTFGLAKNIDVQNHLKKVYELELVPNGEIPLFKDSESYFFGGMKSFYTLIEGGSKEEVSQQIAELKSKYRNVECLISVPFEVPGVKLLNYVFETRGIDDPEKRYDLYEKKTRNLVRKSYKNDFVLKVGKPPENFYNFYKSSIVRLGGKPKSPVWFLELENNLSEHILTFSLFDKDKLIATNFCLIADDYVYLMFNVSDPEYWDYAVNDRLYDELIKWGIERGISHVDFGPSVTGDSSHNHFKEGFGAKRWYTLNQRFGGLLYRLNAFLRQKKYNLGLLYSGGLVKGTWKLFKAKRILRYLSSGGTAFLTNIFLLFIFTELFKLHYLVSGVFAFILATILSFFLQKQWTFQDGSKEDVHKKFIIFTITAIANLILNTLFLYVLVDKFSFHYISAQILSGILLAIWSYFIYKIVIFKKK